MFAVDAQSDLDANAGALARPGGDSTESDYVRWEVAGAPHVPVFGLDLRNQGAAHQNPMDWSPIWRSAFEYLNRWVTGGDPPPTGPFIEGRMVNADSGPAWEPVPDNDGNAVGGIRLPPLEAPLGVYTGFDFSWLDPDVARGFTNAMIFSFGGRFQPFDDGELARRYPTRATYREVFEAAARRAFEAGFIVEEDLRRYLDSPLELPHFQSTP